MSFLPTRVRRTLEERRLVSPGDRVVAAVSGGPDSLALAWALREALPVLCASLSGLAHLHHGLRGDDADADEKACAGLADELCVPLVSAREDVRALAASRRISIEAAGHEARAKFFERARGQLGAASVATGHTRNDQAETVLLRVLRGAGRRGLGGIRYRSGCVIRPLLDATRPQVEAFLAARGLAWRTDRSNLDLAIVRNRVRHELLPALARKYSPGVVEALARLASVASDEDDWLASAANEAVSTIVQTNEDTRVGLVGFLGLPRALQRRVLEGALSAQSGGRPLAARHIEALLASVTAKPAGGWRLALPGQWAAVDGDALLLTRRTGRDGQRGPRPAPVAPRPRVTGAPPGRPLAVPGRVEEPGAWEISAAILSSLPGPLLQDGTPARALLDARAVGDRLFVRTRRPGDRFRPLGLAGRKKLQDYFVDRKVPRAQRDAVPLVVNADDRIVWVSGHGISEEFRVSSATTGVLLLELRGSGG